MGWLIFDIVIIINIINHGEMFADAAAVAAAAAAVSAQIGCDKIPAVHTINRYAR